MGQIAQSHGQGAVSAPGINGSPASLLDQFGHYAESFSEARLSAVGRGDSADQKEADRWTILGIERKSDCDTPVLTSDDEMWSRMFDATTNSFRSGDIRLSDGHSVLVGLYDYASDVQTALTHRLSQNLTPRSILRHPSMQLENCFAVQTVTLPTATIDQWTNTHKNDQHVRRRVFPLDAFQSPETPRHASLGWFKRATDLVTACAGIILLLPVFIFIATIIKLRSPGPVLFRQKRLGYLGNEFTIWKFRTMHVNSDESVHRSYMKEFIGNTDSAATSEDSKESPPFKIKRDPRVFAFGRWLRRWSLDELPQLVNVIKGEMSIVGPRPSVHYEKESYKAWHHQRLDVMPGLTGMWQVYGRGWTTFDEMARLDIQYIRSWSYRLDWKLILFTAAAVLSRRGAA